jgi:hypothetical protein
MRPYALTLIAFLPTSYQSGLQVSAAETPPLGVYLWYPGPARVPTEEDCAALIREIQPSRDRAEDWLWGRVPDSFGQGREFYLFLSSTRMETTFSAEGDFNFGSVQFGTTTNGATSFTLIPDDHPDITIQGTVRAQPDSRVIVLRLRDIPTDAGKQDRVSYYCRFEDLGIET